MARAERVAELIRTEISDILNKKINDPRIGFTSITHVDVTDDLKHAQVFVSVYGEKEQKEATMDGLNSAKGFIRSSIAPHFDLKFFPVLSFKLDDSIEKASKVFKIINDLRMEDERPAPKRTRKKR